MIRRHLHPRSLTGRSVSSAPAIAALCGASKGLEHAKRRVPHQQHFRLFSAAGDAAEEGDGEAGEGGDPKSKFRKNWKFRDIPLAADSRIPFPENCPEHEHNEQVLALVGAAPPMRSELDALDGLATGSGRAGGGRLAAELRRRKTVHCASGNEDRMRQLFFSPRQSRANRFTSKRVSRLLKRREALVAARSDAAASDSGALCDVESELALYGWEPEKARSKHWELRDFFSLPGEAVRNRGAETQTEVTAGAENDVASGSSSKWEEIRRYGDLPSIVTGGARATGRKHGRGNNAATADVFDLLDRSRADPRVFRDADAATRAQTLWKFSGSHGVSWDQLDEEYIKYAETGQTRAKRWAECVHPTNGENIEPRDTEEQILSNAQNASRWRAEQIFVLWNLRARC